RVSEPPPSVRPERSLRDTSTVELGSRAAETKPPLILVADDDKDIARFVEVNLRLHGFDVLVAQDGEQALTLVRDYQPDLAVLDVRMPKIDGVELTRMLRADPLTAALPIIMLTAKGLTV